MSLRILEQSGHAALTAPSPPLIELRLLAKSSTYNQDYSDRQVRAYIQTILQDSEFLTAPKKYVDNWIVLSQSQPAHFPQSVALTFFKKHYHYL